MRTVPPVDERSPPSPPELIHGPDLADSIAAWPTHNNIRLGPVLPQELAHRVADAILNAPLQSYHVHDSHIRCFLWRTVLTYDPTNPRGLASPFGELADWVQRILPALATAITGRVVSPPVHPCLSLSVFRKGCYLDTHNDHGSGAALAWVLGLTREQWDLDSGGSLEFVSDAQGHQVLERRAPAFNTLDLYTVHPVPRWHRVSLLLADVMRVTVRGWLPIEGTRDDA